MRILALDVGEKTIGVAASDELLLTAQGIEVIRRTNIKKDFSRLRELVDFYQADTIIVGLPKNMNGSVGARGEYVQNFVDQLRPYLPAVTFKLWDERLSTVAAEKMLIAADVSRQKRKRVIDKMAAVIILQGYLDSLARHNLP